MLSIIHNIGPVGGKWDVVTPRRRPRETSTNRRTTRLVFDGEPVKNLAISKMINDYNHNMNGVDIADQYGSYCCEDVFIFVLLYVQVLYMSLT
jgi:hypothetical protein